MGNKTRDNVRNSFSLLVEGSVPADDNAITLSPVIADGNTVTIVKFGGCVLSSPGVINLQFGSGGTWETVRSLCHTYEFDVNKVFVGDGVKRFRIIRRNLTGSAQAMVAWLETLT